MLTQKQTNFVNKVAAEYGFNKFKLKIEAGSKKGDNYLGIIFSVKILEGDRQKSLIIKCADKNEELRKQFPVTKCYQREAFIYKEVIPAFLSIQNDVDLPHPTRAFAKFHGACLDDKEEFLVFDNMKAEGFLLKDRKLTMNHDHIEMIIKELAKIHSLSFVLKHHRPEQYAQFSENLNDYLKDFFGSWVEQMKKRFSYVYSAVKENDEAINALKGIEQNVEVIFKEVSEDNLNLVIIHGDSWCNNLLFKYEDALKSEKPTTCCFLDWQISKIGSPAYDLCYFLFLSGSKDILENHKKYLSIYYKILGENLNSAGININEIFPYDLLEAHWKMFCKVVFFVAVGNMDFLLRDESEAKTLSEMVEGGRLLFDDMYQDHQYRSELYYKRMADIVSMLLKYKYI